MLRRGFLKYSLMLSTLLLPSLSFSAETTKNRINIKFKTEDGYIKSSDLDGQFTLLWFYDVNCGYCKNSLVEFSIFVDMIKKQYGNKIQVIPVHTVPVDFKVCKNFFKTVGKQNLPLAQVIDMEILDYLFVKSTPTLIVLDPYLNIVDKINGSVQSGVYIRHMVYILERFKELNK